MTSSHSISRTTAEIIQNEERDPHDRPAPARHRRRTGEWLAVGGRWAAPAGGRRYVGCMSVRFGVFVPQGWKMDLVEIADPVDQFEAMTAVARVADAGPWDAIWV